MNKQKKKMKHRDTERLNWLLKPFSFESGTNDANWHKFTDFYYDGKRGRKAIDAAMREERLGHD